MSIQKLSLSLKWLGIDTHREAVIYMREDCHACRSEGLEAPARVMVTLGERSIIATLNIIQSDLLTRDEASLSTYAWNLLQAKQGSHIFVRHSKPVNSLSYIHAKIDGEELAPEEMNAIIQDIAAGQLSDVQVAMFLTACAGNRLNKNETFILTTSMIETGQRITWDKKPIVDKHCVGGLPGNRTSLIIVPIVAAFGLTIPKTSSRAITSPAGTADTMEVFAPVNLDLPDMRKVVDQENGCLVWGGSVALSPVDDTLIQIERAIDLDGEGQMVASILSKKIAAGSTHILIDMPIGHTAKIRSRALGNLIKEYLESIGKSFGIKVRVAFTDGNQPIGRGIGPALEARDVLAVLKNDPNAPQDLRDKSLLLAGEIIEFSPSVANGTGRAIAEKILTSGQAFKKFQAICLAQGGYTEPTYAPYTYPITASMKGNIKKIDNRRLAQVAKLAGAPMAATAGLELFVRLGTPVEIGQPLFTIHAETEGELNYALQFLVKNTKMIQIM